MTEWQAATFGVDYSPKAGDRVRVTIEGRVARAVGGDRPFGVEFHNGAEYTHTVYLNQDGVTIEAPKPPKPEEPQGLGAVVEVHWNSGEVERATRFREGHQHDWVTEAGCHVSWEHLPATRVIE